MPVLWVLVVIIQAQCQIICQIVCQIICQIIFVQLYLTVHHLARSADPHNNFSNKQLVVVCCPKVGDVAFVRTAVIIIVVGRASALNLFVRLVDGFVRANVIAAGSQKAAVGVGLFCLAGKDGFLQHLNLLLCIVQPVVG